MRFVADCSVAMAWVLKDESTAATSSLLEKLGEDGELLVPQLWVWEVTNVLLMAQKRKRLTVSEARECLADLRTLPIHFDEDAPASALDTAYNFAGKHGLTSYDAAYLATATREGLPLATLDAHLRKAAAAEGVALLL